MSNELVFYNLMVAVSFFVGYRVAKKVILKQFDKDVSENDVETYLKKQIVKLGGRSEKFKTPGRRSAPDQLCTFPHAQLFWVEVKAPGKVSTLKQHLDHERRRAMGFKVYVVDSKPAVDELIQKLAKELYLL